MTDYLGARDHRAAVRFASIFPILLAASFAGAACSASNPTNPNSGGGGTGTGTGGTLPATDTLTISPVDAVLELPAGQAGTLEYKAVVVGPGGSKDLTQGAFFSIDDDSLGQFTGATFHANGTSGTSTVRVSTGDKTAQTSITVRSSTVIITPGAPPDSPTKFGGPEDASKAPSMVYPADGVLVPPNMNVLEFQFMPGAGNDLFELTFKTPSVVAQVYLTCNPVGPGCGYTPDATVWKLVSDAARGTEPVEYTLKGVSQADPTKVGVAPKQKISFGKEDMLGGLYYWNAAAGATMRYEFGKSGQTAELFMSAPQAGAGICVGCHVVSRDGKRMVAGLDFPGSAYKVFDVASKAIVFTQPQGGSFFSFSPDSTQVLTNDTFNITLRDAASGAQIGNTVGAGAMPDWSPDGKNIVFAKGQGGITGVNGASLETLKFDGANWVPGQVLVPYGGQNNYYPSYSPDNGWVLFNRSSGSSYDAPDARVWAVSSKGGQPIELTAASSGGDSWPKWSPLAQGYKSGTIMWLTFASRRPYGLRLQGGQTAQIWMTAFDPARAAMGLDPSYPAFWLPFQDMASGNHIAQWVLHVDRKPCVDNSVCEASEVCKNGVCEPIPK